MDIKLDTLLAIVCGVVSIFLLIVLIALYCLWRLLHKNARWRGFQNPYGWPAGQSIVDVEANTKDTRRVRPSRLRKNIRKMDKLLGPLIPKSPPPPVPPRSDSLSPDSSDTSNRRSGSKTPKRKSSTASTRAMIISNKSRSHQRPQRSQRHLRPKLQQRHSSKGGAKVKPRNVVYRADDRAPRPQYHMYIDIPDESEAPPPYDDGG